MDHLLFSNVFVQILTNFTELINYNNSIRVSNLDFGQYEICLEFQMNFKMFIYQPRDGCIPIRVGELSYQAVKANPVPVLFELACSIPLFFIFGLIIHWNEAKCKRKRQNDDKPRSRSASILSVMSWGDQRARMRNLFYHYIDQPQVSHIRQWARS